MRHGALLWVVIAVSVAAGLGGSQVLAGTATALTVTSVQPDMNGLNAPVGTSIVVNFDQAVNPATVNANSFRVFGRWSGRAEGSYAFSNANQTVTFTPNSPFSAGENVMVTLSHDLASADGGALRAGGFSWKFWTRARKACWEFTEIDTMSNYSTPPAQTRIYGALGSDLNNDGYLDITTVNEVSADLRVFINKADGTGLYHPWLQPASPGLFEMSPNEPADFNNDGNSDVCVCSSATDKVLVFLGLGNGAFGPAQIVNVGDQPLGIAVLDFDGDGDPDIVNGNLISNNMSRMTNNGAGVFGAAVFFSGGVNGEYGCASADMDRDGILDVVVGGNSNQQMAVLHCNGNSTFTVTATQTIGGMVWQVGTGDLNGDGWEDIHTANSFSNSGSIILNNGAGGLNPPLITPFGNHIPASDCADFDGDGDLDWILSSYGGWKWGVFENNGAGGFQLNQEFPAPSNPACSTAMDIDNDRDLDIVLLDEIADVVVLMKNVSTIGDTNCDQSVNIDDLLAVIGSWGPCGAAGACAGDSTGNGVVDIDDLLAVIGAWGVRP